MNDQPLCASTLNSKKFFELVTCGTVLEESSTLGPKVIALPDNRFLKILRVKGRFSTWGLINPAKRFVRNTLRLKKLGVPSPDVEDLYRLPHLNCWAVKYRGLEGITIRELMETSEVDDQLLDRLSAFILSLHDHGVYFRGLHPGNILITDTGSFGLIDILDCHFRFHLFDSQRKRNFKHFFRYPESQPFEQDILSRYYALKNK